MKAACKAKTISTSLSLLFLFSKNIRSLTRLCKFRVIASHKLNSYTRFFIIRFLLYTIYNIRSTVVFHCPSMVQFDFIWLVYKYILHVFFTDIYSMRTTVKQKALLLLKFDL